VNLTSIRNVTSITNTADISCINSFRFVSERVATAVFPTTAFGSGQRIDRQVIRISAEQLARAERRICFSSRRATKWAPNATVEPAVHPTPVYQNEAVGCTLAATRDPKMGIREYTGHNG